MRDCFAPYYESLLQIATKTAKDETVLLISHKSLSSRNKHHAVLAELSCNLVSALTDFPGISPGVNVFYWQQILRAAESLQSCTDM
jgi:hypothetical protein